MTTPCPTEHQEQVLFVREFERRYPDLWIFAIPNGGVRHIRTASNLKAEGVRRGVPDLQVPALNLWIEMKRIRDGRIKPEQKDRIAYLRGIGHTVIVGRGAEDALAQVEAFMSGLG